MTSPRKLVRLTSAAAIAGLLVTACSQAPSGQPAPKPRAPSPEAPTPGHADPVAMIESASGTALDSGAMRLSFQMDVSVMGQHITGTGRGEVSLQDQRQHVTFDLSGMPGLSGGGVSMEEILDGSTLYLRSSALQQVPGMTTDWISMDLDHIAPGLQGLASVGTGQSDPTSAFGYLRGVKDAHVVGTEEIHGVETTHYSGTLDLADATRHLPAKLRAAYRSALRQLQGTISGLTIPFDVWIDGDGRLRRMSYRIDSSGSTTGAFSMQATIDVTAYADHITVHVPPASDVTDATDLTNLAA